MVESDKPFKNIEVVDSRTSQLCKVACMSCIRGHRTTSCGIPVCRTKVFWTVKRPGRPSNSCTCRYGASGRCKCVVVKPACPHKSKKGEKRSGECRCDEQGRYCCLIEPDHWNTLLATQNPTVDFFPTREALEARQPSASTHPVTLVYSIGPTSHYGPTTPGPNGHHPATPLQPMTPTYSIMHSSPPMTTLTPRFGMMGVGGLQGGVSPAIDPMAWQGDVPQPPHQYFPRSQYQPPQPEESSCCQKNPRPPQPQPGPPYMVSTLPPPDAGVPGYQQFTANTDPRLSIPAEPPAPSSSATFHYDKINVDYFNYQFPNAICQNCGLNGCTCKSCPPVMQSFSTGSWAQCCGRKHANRPIAIAPTSAPAAAPPDAHMSAGGSRPSFTDPPFFGTYQPYSGHGDPEGTRGPLPIPASTGFDPFTLDRQTSLASENSDMQMSDLLMSELDRPSSGCGCSKT